ncbi:MAG: FAD-binding protein [Dehalococcoidia bacterium]|nr:FAD-binding protein [Dehalococcoidia bacterium]
MSAARPLPKSLPERWLLRELGQIVGAANVLWRPEDLLVYEYDATIDKGAPEAVVLPGSAEEVAAVVRLAAAAGIPVVPRGAGTGLSGGALAVAGGLVIGTSSMRRLLELDPANLVGVAEPGLVNADLSQAAAPYGLHYVPDPSSQKACTIGGNVAENSGGPHCLAYGVTTNYVLGLEVCLASGELVWLGGKTAGLPGYDLTGAFVGSEGTFGIATKVVLRLSRLPQAVRTILAAFPEMDQASRAVSDIIGAGMVPAALEMLDKLTIQAVEPAVHAGYPPDAGAVLLIEVEGLPEEEEELQAQAAQAICQRHGAQELRVASLEAERERLWAGRKGAIGALGRLAPNYYILDGVVPRTKLPEVLRRVGEIGAKHGFAIANVFHAGDGNLHPNVLFDERVPGATERVLQVGAEIMRLCVEAGGTLTGEHGIGVEKQEYMSWLFTEADLAAMGKLRRAFGAEQLFNPGKVFPNAKRCVEVGFRIPKVAGLGPEHFI